MEENNHQNEPELSDQDLKKFDFFSLVLLSRTSNHIRNRIRSPEFAKMHMRESLESKTNRCLLLSTDPKVFLSVPVVDGHSGEFYPQRSLVPPFIPVQPQQKTEIVGHCAGLVCITSHGFPLSELAIWNPSLSRHHYVPTFPWLNIIPEAGPDNPRRVMMRNQAVYGFGFNPDTETHEILQICRVYERRGEREATEVWIYSLATRSWERLADLNEAQYGRFEITTLSGSPFLEDHMHWAIQRGEEGVHDIGREVRVLAFGARDRRFRDFAGPRPGQLVHGTPRVWMVGETLCFIECRADGRVGVYKMREYGNEQSWTMTYNLHTMYNFDRFESAFPLMEIAARGATLFLGNHSRITAHYQGVCYVQSFLLADGEELH